MQKSEQNQAVRAHRRVGTSTTLNRKYVRRPQRGTQALEDSVWEAAQAEAMVAAQEQARKVVRKKGAQEIEAGSIQRSPKIQHFNRPAVKVARTIKITDEADMNAEKARKTARLNKEIMAQKQMEDGQALMPMSGMMHPLQAAAVSKMQQRKSKQRKLSAKEIKDREIKKALASSSRVIDKNVAARERAKKRSKMHFGIARVMLAVSCAAAAVLAIVYFVGTNMPDISMRVAAMQTGIRASYPGYVPRGYNMTDLSSENGKVVLNFRNDEENATFTLAEENSSWDSNALLTNYVKPEFGDDNFTIVREQGLTIYAADKGAAWVNGGVVYKLTVNEGELTKKQIRSIAVSL